MALSGCQLIDTLHALKYFQVNCVSTSQQQLHGPTASSQ